MLGTCRNLIKIALPKRLELLTAGLEAVMLTLHQGSILFCRDRWIRTTVNYSPLACKTSALDRLSYIPKNIIEELYKSNLKSPKFLVGNIGFEPIVNRCNTFNYYLLFVQ